MKRNLMLLILLAIIGVAGTIALRFTFVGADGDVEVDRKSLNEGAAISHDVTPISSLGDELMPNESETVANESSRSEDRVHDSSESQDGLSDPSDRSAVIEPHTDESDRTVTDVDRASTPPETSIELPDSRSPAAQDWLDRFGSQFAVRSTHGTSGYRVYGESSEDRHQHVFIGTALPADGGSPFDGNFSFSPERPDWRGFVVRGHVILVGSLLQQGYFFNEQLLGRISDDGIVVNRRPMTQVNVDDELAAMHPRITLTRAPSHGASAMTMFGNIGRPPRIQSFLDGPIVNLGSEYRYGTRGEAQRPGMALTAGVYRVSSARTLGWVTIPAQDDPFVLTLEIVQGESDKFYVYSFVNDMIRQSDSANLNFDTRPVIVAPLTVEGQTITAAVPESLRASNGSLTAAIRLVRRGFAIVFFATATIREGHVQLEPRDNQQWVRIDLHAEQPGNAPPDPQHVTGLFAQQYDAAEQVWRDRPPLAMPSQLVDDGTGPRIFANVQPGRYRIAVFTRAPGQQEFTRWRFEMDVTPARVQAVTAIFDGPTEGLAFPDTGW